MANQRMNMSLTLVVVVGAMLSGGATAQSDCTNVLISLSPCLNYITGNSSTPSSSCCTQLAIVVRSKPQCLCEVLNGGASSLGININQTQALALPGACNVQTPPTSRCNAAAPGDTPNTAPSGRGSNSVPSTDSGSSDGSFNRVPVPLIFFFLFIASFASTYTIY
ncbi:hypothetical protein LguiA_030940 [Lonicera macranthoides]